MRIFRLNNAVDLTETEAYNVNICLKNNIFDICLKNYKGSVTENIWMPGENLNVKSLSRVIFNSYIFYTYYA